MGRQGSCLLLRGKVEGGGEEVGGNCERKVGE